MRIIVSFCLGSAALLLAATAEAQHVSLDLRGGEVTLDARNATLEQVLAEWTRVGGVRVVVTGGRVTTPPFTLLLRDITEREALDILLREVGGYLLFARRDGVAGDSVFEQILIVPPGRVPQAPPPSAASQASLQRNRLAPSFAVPQTQANSDDDLDDDAFSQPGGGGAPFAGLATGTDVGSQETLGGAAEAVEPLDAAVTVPVDPGQRPPTPLLPPSQEPDPRNPFGNTAGASRPGTVLPTGPPPGVVYPPVTNPDLERQQNGAVILR